VLFRSTLSVYADTASSSGNAIQYRSEASVDVAVGNPPAGIANTNDCNGFYKKDLSKNTVWNKNFGDPNCEFATGNTYAVNAKATDAILSYLKQVDAVHADAWFRMISIESSYDPNAWLSNADGCPKDRGCWGLLQMGSSNPPGQPLSTYSSSWGINGLYDRGDVYWKQGINAACEHILTFGGHNVCDYFQSARNIHTCFIVSSCNVL